MYLRASVTRCHWNNKSVKWMPSWCGISCVCYHLHNDVRVSLSVRLTLTPVIKKSWKTISFGEWLKILCYSLWTNLSLYRICISKFKNKLTQWNVHFRTKPMYYDEGRRGEVKTKKTRISGIYKIWETSKND